ncbi:MAG TPA: 50S ribosomal protein L2 [Candidatus Nanoarchaeia archaeon]|nr:50S ribosomal protein L2 [Candidatus Nanoarchaeia archaeon]
MGKSLIQQARGKGGPVYRSKGFAFAGDVKMRTPSQAKVEGIVTDIIKSAGHTAPLLEVKFDDDVTCLVQAPEFMKVGDRIQSGPGSDVNPGNMLRLRDIPEGTPIYNIELQPGDGGKFCRTGGSAARVLAKTDATVTIMLPSKKEKTFNLDCRACIGVIAGGGRTEKPMLKAGNMHFNRRMKNKRWPNPSGAAQNAVDHPFGNKRTSRKARQRSVSHFAPPGRKVGKLWPRQTGRKK